MTTPKQSPTPSLDSVSDLLSRQSPPDSSTVEPRSGLADTFVGGYSTHKFGIMLVGDASGRYAMFSDNRQPNVHVLFNTVEELRTAVMLQQAMLASWEAKA